MLGMFPAFCDTQMVPYALIWPKFGLFDWDYVRQDWPNSVEDEPFEGNWAVALWFAYLLGF